MLRDRAIIAVVILVLSPLAAAREVDLGPSPGPLGAGEPGGQSAVPLAIEGRAGWQAVPDPPPDDWSIPARATLRISLPPGTSPDRLLWPAVPGPFVAWRGGPSSESLECWDLRSGRQTAQIRAELGDARRLALSPDGELLAVLAAAGADKVAILSCGTGRPVREIPLPGALALVTGLDFASPQRLVLALASEKCVGICDPTSGQWIARIPTNPPVESQDYAFSPGGHYVAVARNRTQRIELYDLRNGVFAGEVAMQAGPSAARVALIALDFARDGSELAALVRWGESDTLLCWSLHSGELTAEHRLNAPFLPRSPGLGAGRRVMIDFLPGRRGWLLAGAAVVDRQHGGPITLGDDSRSAHPALRRVLDDGRLLVSSGDPSRASLEAVPIPWDTLDATLPAGSSEERPSDVGLPPLTRTDRSGERAVTLAIPTVAYTPRPAGPGMELARAGPLLIDTRLSPIRQMFIASAASARLVVNCDPANPAERPAGLIGSFAGPFTDLYHLKTGKFEGRFAAPYAAELLDVSPSGTVGVFREAKTGMRLDVFRLPDGNHVVGFCPGDAETASERQIRWAALVAEDHLLTQSQSGKVTLWALNGCRAVYSLAQAPNGKIVLDRSRDHFLAVRDRTAYIVDTLGGQVCQNLACPDAVRQQPLSAAAWSADGSRLAALFNLPSGSHVIAWELVSGKPLCDVALPSSAGQLTWTGPGHLALHNTHRGQARPSSGPRRITILDVQQGRVVWHYQLDPPAYPLSGPDDRFWFAGPAQGVTTVGLAALSLPGSEAVRIIQASPPPPPLFGRNSRVRLEVQAAGLPADLADCRQREERVVRFLTARFTESLQSRGITLDDTSSVRLSVSIQNLPREKNSDGRSREDRGPATATAMSTATVGARMSIDLGRERLLWERAAQVDAGQVDAANVPAGVTRNTWIQLRQWDQATRWCLDGPLPAELHHPELQSGLGESRLTVAGPRLLQRSDPAAE